jgi:hypothetical protein
MFKAILPIGFCAFCLMIGHAALEAGTSLLQAEAVEICHRSGSLDCPPLPR